MQCLECRNENPADAKFCVECGTPLTRACARCGVRLPMAAKFCGECGQAVGPVSTPPATPLAAGDAERRQLTVMFCHLVASTDPSRPVDTEDLRIVMRAHQEAASEAIERHEGHVAQYLEDGLLVYFGYPLAHEDDAARAVRAGLEVLTALDHSNDGFVLDHGVRLAARIGIHTGPVVVGAMGGGSRTEILALGDTTNIAARVQSVATTGTVLMSETTKRLVAGLFVVEERGAHRLKGVAEPMVLHRVVQPSGVQGRLDVSAGRLTRFVGREVELATLVDRWERAQDGEGQSVVVIGEAGAGKSRLVHQLHEHLKGLPHTWLQCTASPYAQGTPLHPLLSLVSERLAFTPQDAAAEELRKLEVGFRTELSAETVALVADFLGLPPAAPLEMSPELQRRKMIELLLQWILSWSMAHPVVLFVEDLHWCDASTLELLGRVVGQSATARVLFLATARPEFTSPWPARSNLSTVQLARLTRRQARDLVAALESQELPADTIEALVSRADGVPLYLEELTKTMAASGAARGVEAIPGTLADSLMARLDRLTAAKEVAQRASVLGREFAYPLLEATADLEEAALRQGLARLVEEEIVFARGEPPAATYTFKHALLQEAAYGSLLKRTRQELHARIGKVLEERFPRRAEAEPELVARHYDHAGLAAQASAHYQRAGERAARKSANEEAIDHLRRALDLVGTLPESRERDRRELDLQMALGGPLAVSRGWSHPEYELTFARARDLATRIGDSPELPRVLAGMAGAYVAKGDLAAAAEVAGEALIAAERTGVTLDRLTAHCLIGQPLLHQGDFSRALQHFEQSIELYDPGEHGARSRAGGFDRGLHAHGRAALCHMFLGRPDRALDVSEWAVALAKRSEHPESLADALFWAGVVHFERGEPDRLWTRMGELLELGERLGLPLYLGVAKVWRGWVKLESGGRETGVAEMQQAMVELAAGGSGIGAPLLLFVLAESLRSIGRHDEALGTVDLGLARAEQRGDHFYDSELHRLRGEILLDAHGDVVAGAEAEALFERSREIARRRAAKSFELRAATSLARLWQRQKKREAARALLAAVYDWFTEGFETRDVKAARAFLDELHPRIGA